MFAKEKKWKQKLAEMNFATVAEAKTIHDE